MSKKMTAACASAVALLEGLATGAVLPRRDSLASLMDVAASPSTSLPPFSKGHSLPLLPVFLQNIN